MRAFILKWSEEQKNYPFFEIWMLLIIVFKTLP